MRFCSRVRCLFVFIPFVLSGFPVRIAFAQRPAPMPSMKEQVRIQQEWLKLRLERELPGLMRQNGVAMWIVDCREYNEDPVFRSLTSPTVISARRRTILVFFDRGIEKGIERLGLGGGSNGGLYTVYRDPESAGRELYGSGQYVALRKIVEERKPYTIALDISATHAFSDGLSVAEYQAISDALGPQWMSRVIHAERLPLDYIDLRLPEMMPTFAHMMEIAHWLIARAFSNEVITPGKTTTSDVVWWFRQQVNDLGLATWFQPSVDVQRPGQAVASILSEREDVVIQHGDVLHCDFGISAMGLNTDTQHLGYVLREGEKDAPEGIKRALLNANRLQDLLMERMRPGRTGNEVLADALGAAKAAGLIGSIYAHPIGDHGHGAGPLIGLWDRQEDVPGRGDVPVLAPSWFSIELSAKTPVPEWKNQDLTVAQEEDAALDSGGKISWVLRRQVEYHLVR
ncbi:MAG TPA: M24 family metallopeptidase [Acidobacteriota bacterium]|nr:M24 family metallopeptidase [Acidobacteriota bacterium]